MIHARLLGLMAIIFTTFNVSPLQAKHFALTPFPRGGGVPTAVLPADQEVEVGAVVTISGSDSSDPEEDALMYRWSLDVMPKKSNSKINDPTAESISFTADMAGLYILRLIVSDDVSNSYPAYTAVRVLSTNMLPVIPNYWFHTYLDEKVPMEVRFIIEDGAHDPDGKIVLFEYDFGDGHTTHLTAEESYEAENRIVLAHFYQTAGNYTATITAVDDRGGRTTITMNVDATANKRPLPKFTATIAPNALDATKYDLRLNASGSSDPDGTISSYYWEISGPNDIWRSFYNIKTASYTYTVSSSDFGEYLITLIAVDNNDSDGATSASIYVGTGSKTINSAPSLVYRVTPRAGSLPLTVSFDASASFDLNGDNFDVFWYLDNEDFGVFPIIKGTTASYTFTRPGAHNGHVALRDVHGNTKVSYFRICVESSGNIKLGTHVFPFQEGGLRKFTFNHTRHHGMINAIPSTNYFWDFGDGNKSVHADYVRHTYEREGTYLVKLTTVDFSGIRRGFVKELTVRNDGGSPKARISIEGGACSKHKHSYCF